MVGVIVIAATNDAESLDEALTREGRFDVKVPINLPTAQVRCKSSQKPSYCPGKKSLI